MTQTISMDTTDRLELGFGRILEGHQEWFSKEYFPTYGPVMAEFGLRTLAPFRVVASNVDDVAPVQGSLGSWPSAEHRRRLHEDPKFAPVLPKRNAALQMSDGHLFEPLPDSVELSPDEDYALVVTTADGTPDGALFRVPLAADSWSHQHEGKFMSLHRWSEDCDRLLAGSKDDAVVLRVRFLLGPPSRS